MWVIVLAVMTVVCFYASNLTRQHMAEDKAEVLGPIFDIAGVIFLITAVYAVTVEILLLLNGG